MSDQAWSSSGWRRLEERAEKAEAERDRYREALERSVLGHHLNSEDPEHWRVDFKDCPNHYCKAARATLRRHGVGQRLGLAAERDRLREALEDLVRWAHVAHEGLQYEREADRELLWEKLAGQPDNPCALDRARAALSEQEGE